MLNCKNYIIYKFKYVVRVSAEKQTKKNWAMAEFITEFKCKLIDKFSPENFDKLVKYTTFSKHVLGRERTVYKKSWMHDAFEIGLDMLEEKYNLIIMEQWSSIYFAIPRKEIELINFFEENKPDWVTTVKKI